jgi:hypothetical protein
LKEYTRQRLFLKNQSAYKIQYLMKKNMEMSKIERILNRNFSIFMRNNDPSRNIAAVTIQRYWKIYKQSQLVIIFYLIKLYIENFL